MIQFGWLYFCAAIALAAAILFGVRTYRVGAQEGDPIALIWGLVTAALLVAAVLNVTIATAALGVVAH